MSSAGGSFSHTSFHIGSDLIARCSTYPDQVPILSLPNDGGSSATGMAAGCGTSAAGSMAA